jgi:hypothetical protein
MFAISKCLLRTILLFKDILKTLKMFVTIIYSILYLKVAKISTSAELVEIDPNSKELILNYCKYNYNNYIGIKKIDQFLNIFFE